MSGGSGNGEYNAVAFAPSRQMMNADVYFCTKSALISGTIRTRGTTPGLVTDLPVSKRFAVFGGVTFLENCFVSN